MFIKKRLALNDKQMIKMASLLIFSTLLFFVYDLNPLLQLNSNLSHEEQQLETSLNQLPQVKKNMDTHAMPAPLNEKNLLALFTHDMSQHHLELTHLQWENEKYPPAEQIIHVLIKGQVIDFAQVMTHSQHLGYGIRLHHLAYHLNENQEPIIEAALSFISSATNMHLASNPGAQFLPAHSYFCAPLTLPANTQPTFSIHDFKMIGFLSQHHHTEALITLPNQNVIIVSQGMIVGQEKARVVTVASHTVAMQLPNQTIYRIEK